MTKHAPKKTSKKTAPKKPPSTSRVYTPTGTPADPANLQQLIDESARTTPKWTHNRDTLSIRREPFPHAVVDRHFDERLLRAVVAEIPEATHPDWVRFNNAHEKKLGGIDSMWGPCTRELMDYIASLAPWLGKGFGIDGLVMETVGGGYHRIEPGGMLDVHTDFNRSETTRRYRRLNLILYLNHGWRETGGHLELWDDKSARRTIAPEFNRMVVFETSERSWHGHPRPASRSRLSIATYFFTDEPPPGPPVVEHSTIFHPSAG